MRSSKIVIGSPLGPLTIEIQAGSVCRIDFGKKKTSKASDPIVKKVRSELDEYFRGKRTAFSFPMTPEGTPFQHKVWNAMNEIPFGKTATYSEVARKIGHPKAIRAVGTACGANPILIAVPCHRVIAKNGLGGYGGGLQRKKQLLALESK